MSPEDQKPGVEVPETVKSPHERAMDRHQAAVEAFGATARKAADMVLAAEREVVESLAEVARYEQEPGIPLPVADQAHIEDLMNVARQLGAGRTGEDR